MILHPPPQVSAPSKLVRSQYYNKNVWISFSPPFLTGTPGHKIPFLGYIYTLSTLDPIQTKDFQSLLEVGMSHMQQTLRLTFCERWKGQWYVILKWEKRWALWGRSGILKLKSILIDFRVPNMVVCLSYTLTSLENVNITSFCSIKNYPWFYKNSFLKTTAFTEEIN